MAQFRPSRTPVRWYARVPRSAFGEARLDPSDFSSFCDVVGDDVDVNLSRAGRDCVTRKPSTERDRYILEALPFADANKPARRRGGPYRIWATDFALLEGKRTPAEISRWLDGNGITTDSYDHGTLNVPPKPGGWFS